MDFATMSEKIPLLFLAAAAVGILVVLWRFRRTRDLQSWTKQMHADFAKAQNDETFRREQLAAAQTELAAYPRPAVVLTVKRHQELFLHTMPKTLFLLGVCGLGVTAVGLYRPVNELNRNWMIYLGPALLLVVGALLLLTERAWANYRRIQLLNRSYVLEKAGKEFGPMFEHLNEILEYYPRIPELWLEKADQLACAGRLDEALAAVKKAQELSPHSIDLKMVEVTYLLRNDDVNGAETALENLAGVKRAASDPRHELYSAALELRRGNREKAKEYAEKALALDSAFSKRLTGRDETLQGVVDLLTEMGHCEAETEKTA